MKHQFKVTVSHVNSRGNPISQTEMDIAIDAANEKAAIEMLKFILRPVKRVKIETAAKKSA